MGSARTTSNLGDAASDRCTSALLLWMLLFLAVGLRLVVQPQRNNLLPTYRLAGEYWIHSQSLYEGVRGFIYSPPIAAAMVPFALLPQLAADLLWRFISLSALFFALSAWRDAPLLPRRGWAASLTLLAVFSLGNLNNGQANLLLIALLLGAIAAAVRGHWMTAALCVAVASYLKIYPLVLGLLLILIYPRELGWRLVLAVLSIGLLAFLFQRSTYVAEQYRSWVMARMAEDRLHWDASNTPQDLWRLLKVVPISEHVYRVVQVASGLFLAWLTWRWRGFGWSRERLLSAVFALACAWMVLCGPATESSTYILLAPAIVFALVYALTERLRAWMQLWIITVTLLQLFALAIISFTPWRHSKLVIIQPASALAFSLYVIVWAQGSSFCESVISEKKM